MFRFTQEPSSGSQSQHLAKITGMVPLCLSICALSVFRRHTRIPTCWACLYAHNRSEYADWTLITHISIGTVEPYL